MYLVFKDYPMSQNDTQHNRKLTSNFNKAVSQTYGISRLFRTIYVAMS